MTAGESDVIEGRSPSIILRHEFIHFNYILLNYACLVDTKPGILIHYK